MKVLATTPIIKEPMTLPYRVVLRQHLEEYVTHKEIIIEGNLSYNDGHYFKKFQEAWDDFLERAAQQREMFSERCCALIKLNLIST